MALQLEVEFLSGLYFGSSGVESTEADWPPQPDRIYSALVATWGSRGEDPGEGEALTWLEALPAPRLHASEAEQRTAPAVFVPPNDAKLKPNRRLEERLKSADQFLPTRPRKERRLPAAWPHDPVLRIVWPTALVSDQVLAALNRIAADVTYVGRSASLARLRFERVDGDSLPSEGRAAIRGTYPGRLHYLRERFRLGLYPEPGNNLAPAAGSRPVRANVFGSRWLLLDHVGGTMPDIRATSLVARGIRRTIMSGYARAGLGDAIPEAVSGHTSDGRPTDEPHMAVVPLPFVGFPYADGRVLGFAVVPPAGSSLLDDEDFLRALRQVAPADPASGRRTMTVQSGRGSSAARAFSIEFTPTFDPPAHRRSLDPTLYLRPATTFATVTPIALDRHLKTKGEDRTHEAMELVSGACEWIGLPRPTSVIVGKHATLEGVPSAYPSGDAPVWTGWRLPRFLRSRPLIHAVIHFDQKVDGPVALGAGRFVGMGLCRPLGKEGSS